MELLTNFFRTLKKHPLVTALFFFFIVNCGITYNIAKNFTPTINYRENFENMQEYAWHSTDGTLRVTDHYARVDFDESIQKIYLHMFETYKASTTYKELSYVPDDIKKIQFDCLLTLKPGLTVTAYLEQFDADGERIEEGTKIEKIETDSIRINNSTYGSFFYSIKVRRHPHCKQFNVLFDVRPNGEAGYFVVNDADIIME